MARGKTTEEKSPGIVVLYTALMILLLAFFILLNVLSQVEEVRVRATFESLVGAFGFQPGGFSPFRSQELKTQGTLTAPLNQAERDYQSLRGLVLQDPMAKNVKLLRSDSVKNVVMPALFLFGEGEEELSPQAKDFLAQVAQVLKTSNYPLSLNGHTDSAETEVAGDKDNWEISARRALAVLRFLLGQGIQAKRMAAFGLAGYQPLAPNTSAHSRKLNNRVEMVFDTRDAARHAMPDQNTGRKLDFRGFAFELLGGPPQGEKGRPDKAAGGGETR